MLLSTQKGGTWMAIFSTQMNALTTVGYRIFWGCPLVESFLQTAKQQNDWDAWHYNGNSNSFRKQWTYLQCSQLEKPSMRQMNSLVSYSFGNHILSEYILFLFTQLFNLTWMSRQVWNYLQYFHIVTFCKALIISIIQRVGQKIISVNEGNDTLYIGISIGMRGKFRSGRGYKVFCQSVQMTTKPW